MSTFRRIATPTVTSSPRGDATRPEPATRVRGCATKLRTAEGEALYRRRKAIIEPVFVYIKAIRGFRRFSMRGLDKVRASRLRCPDDSAVVEKTPLSICTSPSSSRWTRESHARIQIWDGEGVNTVPSLSPLG